MQINNHTPWLVQQSTSWGADRKRQVAVIVKTGFRWDEHGQLFALDQDDIPLETIERFFNDDEENASLAAANDLVPFKHGFELLLAGTAYPSHPQAKVAKLDARLVRSHGQTEEALWGKTVIVFGKRYWKRTLLGLIPSDPEVFAPLPVRYEFAYGGKALDGNGEEKNKNGRYEPNPVGQGFAANGEKHWLPQIESEPLLKNKHQQTLPAGFGPIASTWAPRWEAHKAMDAKAAAAGRCPYPQSVPAHLFNSAPEDQRMSAPPPDGAWLQLSGWHSERPIQKVTLPTVRPESMVMNKGKWQALPLVWDTLIIDADSQRLYQLWRGARAVNSAELDDSQCHISDTKYEQWAQQQAEHEAEAKQARPDS